MKMIKRSAFTLAEVLIVLGIIGIICEMTIPTLMQQFQEQVVVTSLKKEYSILSQAYTMAVMDHGDPTNWELGTTLADSTGALNMLNILAPKLKIIKNCGILTGSECGLTTYKAEDNVTDIPLNTSTGKAILADGSTIFTYVYNGTCNAGSGNLYNIVCGEINVDINGNKPPNRLGVDLFLFYLTKNGIVPMGTNLENGFTFSSFCSDKSKGLIVGSGYNGAGCTAWVIYNGNMDYLHCSDLAWDGKHKCS